MNSPRSMLAAAPRVALGHWPTPLTRCDRLREAVGGPTVWLKRDDCSGLALGGNKTRKLEYLLGAALADGADGIITFGALQSNHARQTAAACARLGLTCDLILVRAVDRHDVHYVGSGNVLVDRLLGATLHVVDDGDGVLDALVAITSRAEAAGRTLVTVGPGGSDATGTLGYVDGALELWTQAGEAELDVARVVVAASTAGTAAGLALGSEVARGMGGAGPLGPASDTRLDVVCVYEPAATTAATFESLLDETAARLGCEVPHPSRASVTDDQLGDGYGVPTAAAQHAIDLLARTEGVLLDPVYTAKAFAHLLACIEHGELADDREVVFVHTGGAPGLFAYAPAFEVG